MKFEFTQITEVRVHYLKLFRRIKPTQDEKVHFIWWNELKLTQVELLSFFHFKNAYNFIKDHLFCS